jgi:hypothetical protein
MHWMPLLNEVERLNVKQGAEPLALHLADSVRIESRNVCNEKGEERFDEDLNAI